LSGGADGTISTANVVTAYDSFDSAESVDIALVISGPANATIATDLISMCESRKDCLVFLSPERSDVVNNPGDEVTDTVAYRNTLTSSSYAVLDGNWKYQYDKYNDVYRWVPLNGDIAGLCARTDLERDPWFSPGGLNRGIIKNVIKLAYNPTKTNRDDLYVKGINPVVSFQGEGTVLFGDKTMLSKPSAFDRINVRRLFIVLEKAISRAARFSLFEFNDQFTRAQFVALVEPFLRDVQGRRGITDFRVVCDETNNTGEVIDRNEFVGDIYIKPARSINFIQLNFVAVRTGVSFDEVVGQF
jgi:phage tail sheath protein FI